MSGSAYFFTLNASLSGEHELHGSRIFESKSEANISKDKLLYQLLEDVSKDPTFDDDIQHKLHDILMYHRVKVLNEEQNSMHNLLGISEFDVPSLTHEEQILIHEQIEMSQQKYEGKSKKQENNEKVKVSDNILIEAHESLQHLLKSYTNNLVEHQKLLNAMKELRLQKLPGLCTNKLKEAKLINKMNHLKADLITKSMNVQIFSEADVTLEAYQELIHQIHIQQKCHEVEIEKLNELKAKYKLVDCKEYQAILKEFLQYKQAIERHETFQKNMFNKDKL